MSVKQRLRQNRLTDVDGGVKMEENRRFEIPDEYLARMKMTGSEIVTAGRFEEENDQLSI